MCCFVKGKAEVVLCKKKLEDFTQRWVIAEDGYVLFNSCTHHLLRAFLWFIGDDLTNAILVWIISVSYTSAQTNTWY